MKTDLRPYSNKAKAALYETNVTKTDKTDKSGLKKNWSDTTSKFLIALKYNCVIGYKF